MLKQRRWSFLWVFWLIKAFARGNKCKISKILTIILLDTCQIHPRVSVCVWKSCEVYCNRSVSQCNRSKEFVHMVQDCSKLVTGISHRTKWRWNPLYDIIVQDNSMTVVANPISRKREEAFIHTSDKTRIVSQYRGFSSLWTLLLGCQCGLGGGCCCPWCKCEKFCGLYLGLGDSAWNQHLD